jgi:hypothetical protein
MAGDRHVGVDLYIKDADGRERSRLLDSRNCVPRFLMMIDVADAPTLGLLDPYDDLVVGRDELSTLAEEIESKVATASVAKLNAERQRMLDHAIAHWQPGVIAALQADWDSRPDPEAETFEVASHMHALALLLIGAAASQDTDCAEFRGD